MIIAIDPTGHIHCPQHAPYKTVDDAARHLRDMGINCYTAKYLSIEGLRITSYHYVRGGGEPGHHVTVDGLTLETGG